MEKEEITYPIYSVSPLRMQIDGEGVTTLVTSYGCPLDCKWCINEGTKQGEKERITVEDLYERVKCHNLYYLATGGGITFGGGEPLLQSRFIELFCKTYQNGWKINLETSLCAPWENVERLIPYINFFIVDCKSMNEETYQIYTGQSQNTMLVNLKHLIQCVGSKKIKVRVPLIPEFNSEEEQKESEQCLRKMGFEQIECFPYVIRKSNKKNSKEK